MSKLCMLQNYRVMRRFCNLFYGSHHIVFRRVYRAQTCLLTVIKEIIQWFNCNQPLFQYDEYIFSSYIMRFDEVLQHLCGLFNESNYYVMNPLSYSLVCRSVNCFTFFREAMFQFCST